MKVLSYYLGPFIYFSNQRLENVLDSDVPRQLTLITYNNDVTSKIRDCVFLNAVALP